MKAGALASKQLLQGSGGGTEDTCLCSSALSWISTCEAPNFSGTELAILFKATVQKQPVSPHNGVFTL